DSILQNMYASCCIDDTNDVSNGDEKPTFEFGKWKETLDAEIDNEERTEVGKGESAKSERNELAWSYSAMISLAFKSNRSHVLSTSQINDFIIRVFPSISDVGWKKQVLNILTLSHYFLKVGQSGEQNVWILNKSKMDKIDSRIQRAEKKEQEIIHRINTMKGRKREIEKVCGGRVTKNKKVIDKDTKRKISHSTYLPRLLSLQHKLQSSTFINFDMDGLDDLMENCSISQDSI
ncbi:hypothetical protein PFISCL1PPCAC_11088, partial [Pristionchus fissidentatus]